MFHVLLLKIDFVSFVTLEKSSHDLNTVMWLCDIGIIFWMSDGLSLSLH